MQATQKPATERQLAYIRQLRNAAGFSLLIAKAIASSRTEYSRRYHPAIL